MSGSGGRAAAPSRYLAKSLCSGPQNGPLGGVDAARLQAAREARWKLRRGLWRVSKLDRVTHCGRYLTGDYTRIHVKDGGAYFCDVQTCGSVWACPVCSARIRQRRALQIERVMVAHLGAGHSAGFLTLTFPHRAGESLADLLEALITAWGKVQNRARYRRLVAEIDLLGFIRSTEITYGRWNGWHPHLHLLLLADGLVDDATWSALRDAISDMWAEVVTGLGRKAPGEVVGVTLASVSLRGNGVDVAHYLGKIQDHYGQSTSVAKEMARGDLKKARKRSRTPFELAESAAAGLLTELDLWWEYEAATKGKKAIYITTAVRARYLVEDVSDEELAQADADGEAVTTIDAREYALLVRHGSETYVLDLAEDGGAPAVHAYLAGLSDDDEGDT